MNHWATKDVDNQFEFNKKQRRWLSADDDNQFGPNNIRSLIIGDDDDDDDDKTSKSPGGNWEMVTNKKHQIANNRRL